MNTKRPADADEWSEFDVGTLVEWHQQTAGANDGTAVVTMFISQNAIGKLTNRRVYDASYTYGVETSPTGELDTEFSGWRKALWDDGGRGLEEFVGRDNEITAHYAAAPTVLTPVGYVQQEVPA